MERARVTEILGAFAAANPVDEFVVNGINVWPFFRIQLGFSLYGKKQGGPGGANGCLGAIYKRIHHHKNFLLTELIDYRKNVRCEDVEEGAICFLSASTSRRHYVPSMGWKSIFVDPFRELARPISVINLEYITPQSLKIPRGSRSYVVNGGLAAYRWKNKRKPVEFTGGFLENFQKYACEVGAHKVLYNELERNTQRHILNVEYFCRLFQKLKPRLVCLVCWYSNFGLAACAAANQLGIPTVDFQHGMQSAEHFGYSGWNISGSLRQCVPTYYWVWGSRDKQNLINNNNGLVADEHVLVGGFPWLNRWEDGMLPWLSANEQSENVEKSYLITLHMMEAYEFGFVRDFAKAVDPSAKIYLRLHPRHFNRIDELKGQLPNKNIELEEANKLPLYSLMKKVDYHLTAFSSCALEAIAFGVLSIIFHPNGKIAFADAIADGWMEYADSGQQAWKIVQQNNKMSKPDNHNKYFASSKSEAQAINSLLLKTEKVQA